MGAFGSKPVQPAPIPTDTIVPLHSLDDNDIFRSIILNFTFCFDDVLDADKLYLSLEKLLSREDWRKLGGRMRLNVNFSFSFSSSFAVAFRRGLCGVNYGGW
jgi:hypothetical protein